MIRSLLQLPSKKSHVIIMIRTWLTVGVAHSLYLPDECEIEIDGRVSRYDVQRFLLSRYQGKRVY